MSLKDCLRTVLSKPVTDQEIDSEIKKSNQIDFEKTKHTVFHKSMDSYKKEHITDNDIKKMFFKSFLPKFFDSDLKQFTEDPAKYETYKTEVKRGEYNVPKKSTVYNVTNFGTGSQCPNDSNATKFVENDITDIQKSIENQVKNTSYQDLFRLERNTKISDFWKNPNKFEPYKRCNSVARLLNDKIDCKNYEFRCLDIEDERFNDPHDTHSKITFIPPVKSTLQLWEYK